MLSCTYSTTLYVSAANFHNDGTTHARDYWYTMSWAASTPDSGTASRYNFALDHVTAAQHCCHEYRICTKCRLFLGFNHQFQPFLRKRNHQLAAWEDFGEGIAMKKPQSHLLFFLPCPLCLKRTGVFCFASKRQMKDWQLWWSIYWCLERKKYVSVVVRA